MNDDVWANGVQASPTVAQDLRAQLLRFLWPLLTELDALVDRRLVRTLWQSVDALIRWRNRAHGLLLSELGGYLLSPDQAPAGTKRLSNLLRSPKWTAKVIEQFVWGLAEQRLSALAQADEDALVVWDESVLEKPESSAAPD